MNHNIKPGVATGDQVQEILKLAKEKNLHFLPLMSSDQAVSMEF